MSEHNHMLDFSSFCGDVHQKGYFFYCSVFLFPQSLGATPRINAAFGAGSGNILLDNVACTGDEANITSCVADTNTADCTHSRDAGVTCNADREFGSSGRGSVPNL